MNGHGIVPGRAGFQVVECGPDGSEPRVIAEFVTKAQAMNWLENKLGIPPRPEGYERVPPKVQGLIVDAPRGRK
jgi:hypothetical protein